MIDFKIRDLSTFTDGEAMNGSLLEEINEPPTHKRFKSSKKWRRWYLNKLSLSLINQLKKDYL